MHREPRLRTFTGNRLERLAARLCAELERAPLAPIRAEQVVVPSRGMGAWLERQIALQSGIAASVEFPFPARFVDQLAGKFGLGRPEPVDPFRPAAQLFELHDLFWKIQKGELQSDDLKPVMDHLEGDTDGRKRYQLARRLSGLYARYQFERPKEVEGWRRGGWFSEKGPLAPAGEPWQRELFNRLSERHAPARPPSERILELLERLASGEFDRSLLPERLAVFGASTLPRMIAEVLVALSRHIPVDFYLLVPTSDYTGDLRNRRRRDQDDELPWDLTPAQELVAELGRLGSEFFEELLELDPDGASFVAEDFEDPGSGSVLHHLQSSLCSGEHASVDFDPEDRSLRMHSCHSPLREMEVLRDEVLAALADGAADSVADVLLLVPDIRTYAPFARSVFGAELDNGDGRTIRLPLRVADRSGATDQPYARLLLRLLELASSRLTLSEVFPVLQEEVVREKFDLTAEVLDDLRDRLADAGVIWGVDPEWRAERTSTPRFEGVSWREGIDRLLLGCFTGPIDAMVSGVLPAADATVSDPEALGELATALDRVFAIVSSLGGAHTADEWAAHLAHAVNALTEAKDERHAIERSRCMEILDRLAADADGSGAPVGRLALLDLLGREFAAMESGGGLVGGAITVAELRPMRSLPAQVIAVAGMDAESFPRRDPRDGLDLVAETRKRGDRSPRDDDRQLFLELLLCARERLIISWVGRDQRDDHPRTLSPCVQEVVDTLEGFGFSSHTIQHSLQPFASVNWQESTYDHSAVRAAEALADPRPVTSFVDATLPAPESAGIEHIALGDLQAFWKSPAAWFCKRAADIAMAWDREEAEAEALGLDHLQAWKLRDAALRDPAILDDHDRLRVRFGLPANALVTHDLGTVRQQFSDFAEVAGFTPGELVDEPVEFHGADFIVSGVLRRHPDGPMVSLLAGSRKPRYTVQQIVAHALAGCVGWPGPSLTGPVREPGTLREWKHFVNPEAVLAALVEGYRCGLTRPLHFFPRTTFAFNKDRAKNGEGAVDSPEVQKAWSYIADSMEQHADDGELHEEAVALCMRGLTDAEIFDDEFMRWAEEFAAWIEAIGGKV
jgi:exodeoxyribonuclease V gamma subunit